jgi:hypothetical protein
MDISFLTAMIVENDRLFLYYDRPHAAIHRILNPKAESSG